MEIGEIKRIVNEANGLSKKGENEEALQLLREAWNETEYLPAGPTALKARGLIYHYQGRVEQAMGRYGDAVVSLEYALGFRKDVPVDYAYTMFQRFICKVYARLPISDAEVKETKMALSTAFVDKEATIMDVGNFLQDIAYIEQTKRSAEKAILFYRMTETVREEADDKRGLALTQARLAEIYWKMMEGTGPLAMSYGRDALGYFEGEGDKERIKQVKDIFGWE
jgi:tetratricopeptide (TPR) repeat protein